ncbi:DUF3427 domain-containing protein [Wohlfahrtiimonas chitiniclastica]|uniref:DUF3427 domain-containing protein n=1 Tax=Wohlfahrtiimonas chitiniclastica TaxID=400946 RepID=UPI0007B69CAE|nr:DUF3427 domain-containing protein [Wohlfahrtiimonas chitiniclastica]KZX38017.1 NgoFVII family restriction endonuclease [Wohlfahrtiimonas chitiniclastica]
MNDLLNDLTTSFYDVDHISSGQYLPAILVNDFKREKKVLTTILEQLKTCDEFFISVAFVTTGGVAVIREALDELNRKSIKGVIIVSQYLNFTDPAALERLLAYRNIELRIDVHNSFHAKCFYFEKGEQSIVVIGSSNLTDSALCKNYEFNIKLDASINGEIIEQIKAEQQVMYERSILVSKAIIDQYRVQYEQLRFGRNQLQQTKITSGQQIAPNAMQLKALDNLQHLRDEKGATKALLISATGTGKTYLSAFDVARVQPKKFLFLVHRSTIAAKSMQSYQKILSNIAGHDPHITFGLFDGNHKDYAADYLFATVQTMSLPHHLAHFAQDHFDYIVIDETHRAAAQTYQTILNHFTPKFLLGMTATPERMSGEDIFQYFDHNIAYEIRLKDALEADLLTTFHYYGIADIVLTDDVKKPLSFNQLIREERVAHILEKITHYSTDTGDYRGLVFCSSVEEADALSAQFCGFGFRACALSGRHSEHEREAAIESLESDDVDHLQFIFTVDIFNEGIDIPRVNLIVMLRATQSVIVFVQQLGRGLRKAEDKSYVTVLDFIGNYANNYMIPMALFGDHSYNKDALRRKMSEGSSALPGASSISFDAITEQRIYAAINQASFDHKKDLAEDMKALFDKLGHMPTPIDFIRHGSRDPYQYIRVFGSYYQALKYVFKAHVPPLSEDAAAMLRYFDGEINNAKRIIESCLLFELLQHHVITLDAFKSHCNAHFHFTPTDADIISVVDNLNFSFVVTEVNKRKVVYRHSAYLKDATLYDVVAFDGQSFALTPQFKTLLAQSSFKTHLMQSVDLARAVYRQKLVDSCLIDGRFILYEKYSRKDVFRILNYQENPNAQSVGGYLFDRDETVCPIFVNYHKDENISEHTKYGDAFLNPSLLHWFSKGQRTLKSKDVQAFYHSEARNIALYLFVKKDNDEGREFYCLGRVMADQHSFMEEKMTISEDKTINVVTLNLELKQAVKESLYQYLIHP